MARIYFIRKWKHKITPSNKTLFFLALKKTFEWTSNVVSQNTFPKNSMSHELPVHLDATELIEGEPRGLSHGLFAGQSL